MEVQDLIAVPARSGFYRDDQAAIGGGAERDGFLYTGRPRTEGFSRVREPGSAVSLILVLEDGRIALGDCAEVQYAGVGGRGAVMTQQATMSEVESLLRPHLIGTDVSEFRSVAEAVDGMDLSIPSRYGISQALLDATAQVQRRTMAEVIRDEYSTGIEIEPVPLYAQSGDDRFLNVDKMIMKGVDVLPHGLINAVDDKLGYDGGLLLDYVGWVAERIGAIGGSAYRPVIHIDVYGMLGVIFSGDLGRVVAYLGRLRERAAPYRLRVEHPVDAGSREGQIAAGVQLRRLLRERDIDLEIVADEWCNTLDDIREFVASGAADMVQVKTPDLGGIGNTVEALLTARRGGVGAFCGGTCNETDVSARVSAHIAMACGADQVLAKPGMGVDEGLMIVGNEMARISALIAARDRRAHAAEVH
ncbi:MAG: methylaspartate ammonia-lyase [Microbacterium sp. 69-10]|uniref:methylaspartate ammonia-lyase n=1 Tax=Microbacterium sp. 69-10 TaxID=1895783 RepID=UPI0009605FA4|nr:methylaspartate ammonia-lyase [Microbacterium sp. 69-10]OJU41281.1 MAG: methylaspartate ammonia-lyase [Microbacterium sp. 69-10]